MTEAEKNFICNSAAITRDGLDSILSIVEDRWISDGGDAGDIGMLVISAANEGLSPDAIAGAILRHIELRGTI